MTKPKDPAAPGRTFDWDAAKASLARLQARVDAMQSPPPERAREMLRRRSASLARPRARPRLGAMLDLIVFTRRGQRWATLGGHVREVIDLEGITPLPAVPPTYLGLIHHRGAVYPVIDLALLLGAPAGEPGKEALALIIESELAAVAIAADAVEGYRTVEAASIAEMTPQSAAHPALQGLTADGATVFDAHQLLADPRLVVNDQPAASPRHEGERA